MGRQITVERQQLHFGDFKNMEVVVEKEKLKGKSSEMWTGDADFPQRFGTPLQGVESGIGASMKQQCSKVFHDFDHVFCNSMWPELFVRANMKTIIFKTISSVPIKDRLRKISDGKKPHIEEHIKKMPSEEVIRHLLLTSSLDQDRS